MVFADVEVLGTFRIARTVVNLHAWPDRWAFLSGSAADGQGICMSLSARVIRAIECPAKRCANIHSTIGAACGSGSNRRAHRPHAACVRFRCGPASTSRYP